jgi:hypothetical protein
MKLSIAVRATASSSPSPEVRSLGAPTTCGDFKPKKCALDFGPSRKSMENAPPLLSRVHPLITEFYDPFSSQSPPMTFHIENVFGGPFLANYVFRESHLSPMITLQITPENQISQGGFVHVPITRKQMKHKEHHEHKESKQCDGSSWVSISLMVKNVPRQRN